MKRSTWDGAFTVYRYGTPRGTEFDQAALEQLRLAHDLRNALVAIEHSYATALGAAWASHPDLSEAEQRVGDAEAALQAVVARSKHERQEDRSTRPRPATAVALADARARLREDRLERRSTKERLYPQLKGVLVAARDVRDAGYKDAYRSFVQGQGLHWATYNDVLAGHQAMVARTNAARRAGKRANLRFQRWQGTGSLCVQLKRGAGRPARTPSLLASGTGPWRNVCQLRPWIDPAEWSQRSRADQRRERHGEITFILGRGRFCRLPVLVHRMLPADADVTLVRITRSRIAGHHQVHVSLTARIPAPEPPAEAGPVVAVHLGWRSMPDGSLRVGTYRSSAALAPPPGDLHQIVHVVGPDEGEIHLPGEWRELARRLDQLRSRRDRQLDRMRAELLAWLSAHPECVGGGVPSLSEVEPWRAPWRFARLASEWRTTPPPDGEDIAARLEHWRRRDRHLWEWHANERHQLIQRRSDAWRRVAAWLAGSAGTVVVDAVDVAGLSRPRAQGVEDDHRHRSARANRQLAAPGSLRSALRAATKARGVASEVIEVIRTSVHEPCGTDVGRGPEFAEGVEVWCPTCEVAYDQDANAAARMLAASGRG